MRLCAVTRGARSRSTIALLVVGLFAVQVASAATESEARHNLQQQQLQDTLDLNLQQSGPRARADLSPADSLRLDQLQLRQRMAQQQLEHQQLQQDRLHRNRGDRNAQLEQRLFAQERQMQIQRFDMEQRDLLRSMKPRPLQRPAPGGRLLP